MAKQNVTFVERNVEKIVAGVAGAILLTILFLYVIQAPNTVEVGGTPVSPAEFYSKLKDESVRVADTLKRATPPTADPWKPPTGGTPERVSIEVAVLPVPPRPLLPGTGSGPGLVRGQLELASILAPPQPVLAVGRGRGALPPGQIQILAANQDPTATPPQADPLPSDLHWIGVFSYIDRKAQEDVFAKANYSVENQRLIVAGLEAQRQQLLPNGRWSEARKVDGYAPISLKIERPEVRPAPQDGASMGFTQQDSEYTRAIRDALANSSAQQTILRPEFQPFLEGKFQPKWAVPKDLVKAVDWQGDQRVVVFEEEEEQPRGPRRPGPLGPDGAEVVKPARARIKEALELINGKDGKKDLLKAREILNGVESDLAAVRRDRDEASNYLRDYHKQFIQEELRLSAQANRPQMAADQLGPDKDLFWVNDTSAKPGETYRYRVRVLAVNPYATAPSWLAKPEGAGKVLLAGEWSQWSEPAQLEQSKYLFLVDAKKDSPSVRVEVDQWVNGTWETATQDLGLGSVISFTPTGRGQVFSYEGILACMEYEEPAQQRQVDKRTGAIKYRNEPPTMALAVVTDTGEAEERVLSEDRRRRLEVQQTIKEEKKKEQEADGTDTLAPAPGMERPMPNRPGPVGAPPDMGRMPPMRGPPRGRGQEN